MTLLAFLALFVVILLAVVLPNYELARLREQYAWFNQPMMWAESFRGFNMVHLLLFGALGFVAPFALRAWAFRRLSVVLVIVSGATELVQWVAPGRHPRWSDFAIDVAAGGAGLLAAAALLACWRKGRQQ